MADAYKVISDSITKTEKAQKDISYEIKNLTSEVKAQTKQQKETADGTDDLVKQFKALIKEQHEQNPKKHNPHRISDIAGRWYLVLDVPRF